MCRWEDGYPDSWEPEDHLPQHLITTWEVGQRERVLSSMHSVSGAKTGSGQSAQQQQQHVHSNGSSNGREEHAGAEEQQSRSGYTMHAVK